jgi:hypothetical protein
VAAETPAAKRFAFRVCVAHHWIASQLAQSISIIIMSGKGKEFREKSKTQMRSNDLKASPPAGHVAAHKVPNASLAKAHDAARSQVQKDDIMGHAHSRGNIIYSTNNDDHSRQERDLSSANYHAASVQQKGGSIANSLEKMRENSRSSNSTATVMRTLTNEGDGYKKVVANLDKRTFNSDAEKREIDRARNK